MATSRIIELAKVIAENTSAIQDTLSAKNLPTPTFDFNESVVFPPQTRPSIDVVLDATLELHDLLLSPLNLIQRKSSHNKMACMKAIVRWKIATAVSPDETVSFKVLSERCGLEEKALKHLLRHAMTMRIFREPEKGAVAHTAASNLMRDPSCYAWLLNGAENLWPSSVRLVDALDKWPGSEEPNHTGWNIAHNAEESLYQRVASDPEFASRFGSSMTAMISNNPAFDIKHIHNSFDWESLGNGLVVDVGGSFANVCISLAEKYTSLRFISQDLESTVNHAPPVPPSVADRVELKAHDFFTPQPEKADAYIFRWIFHNWSDKYSALILQALIPALKPGARVLIQDGVLPDPGKIPFWREMDLRDLDLLMHTYFNAWERDAEEWIELFAKADPRFQFVGITVPQGSALALIEARWTGN